jgi:CRP-like cAMP-binding protein
MKPQMTEKVSGGLAETVTQNSRPAFLAQASLQVLLPGVELLQQDSAVSEVYFLKQGLVKLRRLEQNGSEVFVALRSQGWILGVSPALLRQPTPVVAVTLRECQVYRLSVDHFQRLFDTDAPFVRSLVSLLSQEIYDNVARQTQLSTPVARTRLLQFFCQFLPEGAAPTSKDVVLHIPLKEGDIASYLAIHQSTLSKVYRNLEEEGIIRRHKGRTIIRKMEALLPYADPIHTAWKLRGGNLVVQQNHN